MIASFTKYLMSATTVAPIRSVEADSSKLRQVTSAVNIYTSDFGSVQIVPNRLQQVYDSGDSTPVDVVDVFVLDPTVLQHRFLQKPHVNPLAKVGMADKRQISADWTLVVGDEKYCGVIRDCLPSGTVTA